MGEKASRPGAGLFLQQAQVSEIVCRRAGAVELLVQFAGRDTLEKALLYPDLCPQPVAVGDCLLLNTTAVELALGSGGYHFVVANLSALAGDEDAAPRSAQELASAGHIMKLRYTPLQLRCLAVEEEAGPHHAVLQQADTLAQMPVVIAGLHSQIAPIAAAIKALASDQARIAYIMNDTAGLALGFSRLAQELCEKRLLDVTITAGQAFGGQFEAVNIYSALLAAKLAAQADIAILCQGPGNVGTETRFGFGAVYQGEAVNAVSVLEGVPIAAVRLSFADPRPRHRGISQQFLVALGKIALRRAVIPLPTLAAEKLLLLQTQLKETGIDRQHEVVLEEGEVGLEELRRRAIVVTSMGRSIAQDREFFLAAGAAGAAAAKRLK